MAKPDIDTVIAARWPQGAIAKLAGISIETVTRWRQCGLPRTPAGIGIPDLLRWLRERAGSGLHLNGNGAGDDSVARRRRAAAAARAEHQAILAQLDVEERRGELMRREDVVREWCGRIGEVTRALEALPPKLAGILANADAPFIEAELSTWVREVRLNFARPLSVLGAEPPRRGLPRRSENNPSQENH